MKAIAAVLFLALTSQVLGADPKNRAETEAIRKVLLEKIDQQEVDICNLIADRMLCTEVGCEKRKQATASIATYESCYPMIQNTRNCNRDEWQNVLKTFEKEINRTAFVGKEEFTTERAELSKKIAEITENLQPDVKELNDLLDQHTSNEAWFIYYAIIDWLNTFIKDSVSNQDVIKKIVDGIKATITYEQILAILKDCNKNQSSVIKSYIRDIYQKVVEQVKASAVDCKKNCVEFSQLVEKYLHVEYVFYQIRVGWEEAQKFLSQFVTILTQLKSRVPEATMCSLKQVNDKIIRIVNGDDDSQGQKSKMVDTYSECLQSMIDSCPEQECKNSIMQTFNDIGLDQQLRNIINQLRPDNRRVWNSPFSQGVNAVVNFLGWLLTWLVWSINYLLSNLL